LISIVKCYICRGVTTSRDILTDGFDNEIEIERDHNILHEVKSEVDIFVNEIAFLNQVHIGSFYSLTQHKECISKESQTKNKRNEAYEWRRIESLSFIKYTCLDPT
jgi:carbamate kinase